MISQSYSTAVDGSELDELLGRSHQDRMKSACPVLLIGIGGTGAHILRRVKERVTWLGLKEFCRFLVLDTEEAVRGSAGGLPGFENDEFCYLNLSRGRDVIERPEDHQVLADRLDLADDSNRLSLANILTTRARHAGQIRPLGLMSLYANFRTFQNRLNRAVSELLSRWRTLEVEQQLSEEHRIKLENRFYAVLVGSVCGGTGAGILIDVAALLRHELKDRKPEIAAFLTLPEVYEEKLRGKPAEYQRIMANAYTTIREIDYFEHQEAHQHQVELGGTEETRFLAPTGLFERCSFIQRVDAEGFDLGSMEAVYDTVALHIVADVGSTIGGKIAAGDANDVARTGLEVDPRTHRKRRYSTIGATALALPYKRLLYYCTYRRMMEFYEQELMGNQPDRGECTDEVNKWLVASQLEQRASQDNSDYVVSRLKRNAITGLDAYVTGLFRRKNAQLTLYHKNRQFVAKFDELRQKWHDTYVKSVKEALSAQSRPLLDSGRRDLRKKVLTDEFAKRGLRGAFAFASLAKAVFAKTAVELSRESKANREKSIKWDQHARHASSRMRGFLAGHTTNNALQDDVALNLRRAIDASVNSEASQEAAWVMTQLAEEADNCITEIRSSLESAEERLGNCRQIQMQYQVSSRTVTTDSQAEIDISTPEMFERFYSASHGDKSELLANLAAKLGRNEASCLLTMGTDTKVFAELRNVIGEHFVEKMKSLNIMDLLEEQLSQRSDERRFAESRVERALAACRPLWQAEVGVMSHYFSDMIIVGTPDSDKSRVSQHLEDAMENARAGLNEDDRYQAEIDRVTTHDPHRIYAIRLSHGGRPHYLVSWEKYRNAYEAWRKKQAHPIHIFAQKFVSRMPSMEPFETGSNGDTAFALALAYGWIAKRGAFYYFNLNKQKRCQPGRL